MFDALDRAVLNGQFERAKERSVRAGLDDCRFADMDDVLLPIMSVTAQTDRHAFDFAHQFQVLRETKMGQDDDQIDLFFLQFRYIAGQLLTAQSEGKPFTEMGRHRFVDNITGDADHADRKIADGQNFVRSERQLAALLFIGIDRENRVMKLFADFFQIGRTEAGVPVECHGIKADFVQDGQHVPAFRSDRFVGAMDRVAVIENECRIFAAEIFDQALETSIPPSLAER